jgi:hypothetical protein
MSEIREAMKLDGIAYKMKYDLKKKEQNRRSHIFFWTKMMRILSC